MSPLITRWATAARTSPRLARHVSCLGRVTPGVKDTPFLGSAWGVKEAVDLLTRSEFVGGERVRNREQTHSDLPRFRPSCRNSGTWGSPGDAQVEPTPSVPPEDQQDVKPRPEMGRPIPAQRREQHSRTPEGEWVASGSNLSPGLHQGKEVSGFRGPAGGRTAPEGL